MADLVPYKGKKGKTSGSGVRKCEPVQAGDLTAILDLVITASTSRSGRPAYYPDTRQGLDDFINATIDYFEYCETINSNPELEEKQKLIPDIESWACYIGVTRQTIWQYEKRSSEWADVIGYYKNAIGSIKKNLALHNKIPSLVFLFDAANNHQYFNSNQFVPTDIQSDTKRNSIEEQIRKQGLAWDNELKKFVPAEG